MRMRQIAPFPELRSPGLAVFRMPPIFTAEITSVFSLQPVGTLAAIRRLQGGERTCTGDVRMIFSGSAHYMCALFFCASEKCPGVEMRSQEGLQARCLQARSGGGILLHRYRGRSPLPDSKDHPPGQKKRLSALFAFRIANIEGPINPPAARPGPSAPARSRCRPPMPTSAAGVCRRDRTRRAVSGRR